MVAIESAQTDVVEIVIILPKESLPTFIVVPNPCLEALLDLLLFIAGGFCCRHIDDITVSAVVMVIDRGSAEIQGVIQQFQCAAPVRSPLGCIGDTEPNAITSSHHPQTQLRGMAHSDARFAQQILGELFDVVGRNPSAAKASVHVRGRKIGRLN